MGEFMIWGVTDAHSWLDGQQGKTQGLIYDKQYKAKPAYDSLIASLKAHPASEVKSPYKSAVVPPDSSATTDSTTTDSTATDSTVTDSSTVTPGDTSSVAPGDTSSVTPPPVTPGDSGVGIRHEAIASMELRMNLVGRTLSIVGASNAKVQVFDMRGRPVYSAVTSKGSVDLSAISDGLYVVRVKVGSKTLERRVALR